MKLDLIDEETLALLNLLTEAIEADRFAAPGGEIFVRREVPLPDCTRRAAAPMQAKGAGRA